MSSSESKSIHIDLFPGVTSNQPRSLRPRKRTCYGDALGKSTPSGEAMEAKPLKLQKDTVGTVLTTASPENPHTPPLDCTSGPLQQTLSAGDTTVSKQEGGEGAHRLMESSVKGDKVVLEKVSTLRFLSPALDPPPTVANPHPYTPPSLTSQGVKAGHPRPSLPTSEGVKFGEWDGQTTSAEDHCGEKNTEPKMEERHCEQPEAADERDGRQNPPVKDRSREPQTKRRKRMGMCGLGERERRCGVEEEWLQERKTLKENGMVMRRAEEEEMEEDEGQSGDGSGAGLVAVEGTASRAASSSDLALLSSLPPSDPTGVNTEQKEGEEEKEEEEPRRSGDEAGRLSPGRVSVSGPDPVAEVLEVGPQQPVMLGDEELGMMGVVEDNQEGDRRGYSATDPPSFSSGPPPTPLEEESAVEVWNLPNRRETGSEVGVHSLARSEVGVHSPAPILPEGRVHRADSTQAESEHKDSSDQPLPTKPDPGAALGNPRGPGDAALTPGGQEEYIQSVPVVLSRVDHEDAVHPHGEEARDYISDSQLNTITLLEDEDGHEEGEHEDASELVCGLIRELSSLNRLVMATDRELETFRRGKKTARTPTHRVFPPRRTEI
ncbi:uncharacterized protein si:ch211-286b5.2 isoform X2 [Esox lucius]|uniref:uncharacterized protein si:ch211-286b5.2 isoform X2 n=1 Tax=Esox lucius TaxID=8010 RepID=UPI00147711CF|nr:uncharacterized protein si:ch211-286b5.2 isoform X2 [Esox lucius]